MSTTTLNAMDIMKVVAVERREAPRGARIAASLAAQAWRLASFLFTPAAPRPLTRIEEAAEVRRMASGLRHSHPAYANDLFAAADRHELGGQTRA